jgi:hypothetical protein
VTRARVVLAEGGGLVKLDALRARV